MSCTCFSWLHQLAMAVESAKSSNWKIKHQRWWLLTYLLTYFLLFKYLLVEKNFEKFSLLCPTRRTRKFGAPRWSNTWGWWSNNGGWMSKILWFYIARLDIFAVPWFYFVRRFSQNHPQGDSKWDIQNVGTAKQNMWIAIMMDMSTWVKWLSSLFIHIILPTSTASHI